MATTTLTGIYGAPLEMVRGWLGESSAFATFSPDGSVYLYERIGGPEVAAGDAWAVLAWREKQHRLRRRGAGPGMANFDASRSMSLTLVSAVATATNDAIAAHINAVSAIAGDLIENTDAIVLGEVNLLTLGIDEATDPILIGAELELELVL
jgi:hypothetical protein